MRRKPSVQQAFDEVRFGPTRILNLRDGLPSAAEAVARAEVWLRTKQIEFAGEVLVITGRGSGSLGGIPVIRTEVMKLLTRLKRVGVVSSVREHTAGSVAVTLAPLRALFEGAARKKDVAKAVRPAKVSPALAALQPETVAALRRVAERAIESLGVQAPSETMVATEMERQFSVLTSRIPLAEFSERAFLAALVRAADEYDDADS